MDRDILPIRNSLPDEKAEPNREAPDLTPSTLQLAILYSPKFLHCRMIKGFSILF